MYSAVQITKIQTPGRVALPITAMQPYWFIAIII